MLPNRVGRTMDGADRGDGRARSRTRRGDGRMVARRRRVGNDAGGLAGVLSTGEASKRSCYTANGRRKRGRVRSTKLESYLMAVNLNLDDELTAAENITGSATGFATRVLALLRALVHSGTNPFGSAATKAAGTSSGNVLLLDQNGEIPRSTAGRILPKLLYPHGSHTSAYLRLSPTSIPLDGNISDYQVLIISCYEGRSVGSGFEAYTDRQRYDFSVPVHLLNNPTLYENSGVNRANIFMLPRTYHTSSVRYITITKINEQELSAVISLSSNKDFLSFVIGI